MKLVTRYSPLRRHRRWRRLLSRLDLDPDSLPRPLQEPAPGNFIICGCPRSGTALLTAMLFQPPTVITVMEPWDGLRLPPAELFASLRGELASGMLRRGRLDITALHQSGTVAWSSDGASPHPVDYTPSTLVGVKFPAFWRYLGLLPSTKFLVCVRDPAETVQSMANTRGRLAAGLDYDVAFNRSMNAYLLEATPDPVVRRVLLYEFINSRILPYVERPNVRVVRYERWFADPRGQLTELATFLGCDLNSVPVDIHPRASLECTLPPGMITRLAPSALALGYEG